METNTAGALDGSADGSARREAGDRRWPRPVRLLVSVADNLRLARPDATADELLAAMKVAVLAGHVDLASQLGPGGEGLSGGQRRRLAVAQAYLRHPGLLLLDEPTEGLDHHTARALLGNLRSALPGTTIIAAIHDRTLGHFQVAADATVRLAAGRVLRVT